MLWTGRILSALPIVFIVVSGIAGLLKPEMISEGMSQLGYSMSLGLKITIIELIFIVTYLIPRTSVLGAILMTAYLGGATASHLRVGQSPFIAILVAVLLWGGLYCRDARLRSLIPLRK
jgi:hypothetical protein